MQILQPNPTASLPVFEQCFAQNHLEGRWPSTALAFLWRTNSKGKQQGWGQIERSSNKCNLNEQEQSKLNTQAAYFAAITLLRHKIHPIQLRNSFWLSTKSTPPNSCIFFCGSIYYLLLFSKRKGWFTCSTVPRFEELASPSTRRKSSCDQRFRMRSCGCLLAAFVSQDLPFYVGYRY